jgi:hypothetical protein
VTVDAAGAGTARLARLATVTANAIVARATANATAASRRGHLEAGASRRWSVV